MPDSRSSSQDDSLVSGSVAAASTAALGRLAQTVNREPAAVGNFALGAGTTLEDMVREMIRPMLKDWLDTNLAPMVERLVKREIERMVRRAEDD
jgi:cell pole-organizing protein PopZ